MNIEELRDYCLSLKGSSESFPFDEETLVFKVINKMFALIPLEHHFPKISLKCEPERALRLRAEHPGLIEGAYHMNKEHWNQINAGELDNELVCELIIHSYSLIVSKMSKKEKAELENL